MNAADLKTHIVVAILSKVLEEEGIVSSDASMKEMRADAQAIADQVCLYTEVILNKILGQKEPAQAIPDASPDIFRPQEIR